MGYIEIILIVQNWKNKLKNVLMLILVRVRTFALMGIILYTKIWDASFK